MLRHYLVRKALTSVISLTVAMPEKQLEFIPGDRPQNDPSLSHGILAVHSRKSPFGVYAAGGSDTPTEALLGWKRRPVE